MQNQHSSAAARLQSIGAPPGVPNFCPCGRPPLECARETLAEVERLLQTRTDELPTCCQGITRGPSKRYATALRRTMAICFTVRDIVGALREDADGWIVAVRGIRTATHEIEELRIMGASRRARATVLFAPQARRRLLPRVRR